MLLAKQYFDGFVQQLTQVYELDEAKAITNYVSSELLMIKYHQLTIIDKELSKEDIAYFDAILKRLLQQEPVQYVVGFTWFYGLKFEVNQHVLIPRPETEELVEILLKETIQTKPNGLHVLDLGTGSGCIPVSIKKNMPSANVFAVDVMEGALQTARHNARLNKVDINFVLDDMLNPQHIESLGKMDVIISNPPYIDEKEELDMEQHVLRYEPRVALFSPDNPLKFYEAIYHIALKQLRVLGEVWLEINPLYAKETAAIFDTHFQVKIINDLTGKQRFIRATLA